MENNIINLARKEIVAMNAYRSARSEGLQGIVYLDANENAFSDQRYHRYPEPQPTELIGLLAKIYDVDAKKILITRGSDEGIDLLLRLFCHAGKDKVITCPPTYGMYKVAATVQGAEIIEVPLRKEEGFTLDVNALLRVWQPNIKLIFLCSPNNPTGNVLSKSDVLFICRSLHKQSIIVIDEAYIEFSDEESFTNFLEEYPNLVVLRTLSKAYGLAGVRCGVTIANTEIITLLRKIIAPYPIPIPVAQIILQQLNSENTQNIINTILQEKEKLAEFLEKLPSVKKIFKSQANFLLIEVADAEMMMNCCLQQGIVLRNRSNEYGLENCIRITIGLPSENALLREVLKHA